jgi:pyruvate/2-oxoglutarate dehydrogenase complex dihydrolipoamide dehydrogenase (E3) component
VSALLRKRFAHEGIAVLCAATPVACEIVDGEKSLRVVYEGSELRIAFDTLLIAVGRTASVQGFGLEELGIGLNAAGTIAADEYLATSLPNIHVCGDVAGPFQLTHVAAHQAWYAAVNALFGRFRRFRADYRVIPWCTFTDPEVARVGLSETEAKAQGIAHEVTRYDLDDLDRAIADGTREGFVKVLTPPGSDRILGVTLVGAQAGELIAEFVLAMKHQLGLNKLLGTIHIYPTLNEANKYAAGAWKRAQVTTGQRTLLKALQAWQRGAGRFWQVMQALPGLLRKEKAEAPTSPDVPGA